MSFNCAIIGLFPCFGARLTGKWTIFGQNQAQSRGAGASASVSSGGKLPHELPIEASRTGLELQSIKSLWDTYPGPRRQRTGAADGAMIPALFAQKTFFV
jgi:hypothetical protein